MKNPIIIINLPIDKKEAEKWVEEIRQDLKDSGFYVIIYYDMAKPYNFKIIHDASITITEL